MPLFSPYFSLDSSAFRVGNGGRLRCRMGASGIGIYVMLLSHLRDCRDCRAPLDYDMLAFDLHEDAAAVRRVVEDFGLFDIDRSSGTFTSSVLTTVRGMLSDDASAAGVGPVRTVRQRRVRSAGETYRRAVRRLAEDNALPPAEEEAPAEGDAEPAEEVPTSSPNAITPAEGEHQPAEEVNATGDSAPTSIAAEGTPAEVKHEVADADAAPAEVEDQPAEEEDVPTAFADAHSPRREENRKEQNKKPHTPIVPFPQSGKGTRANHPAAAAVGAQEGGDASAEGDEEPVVGDEEPLVGNPLSVPSASAERDAPPCAASPTLLGTPAQTFNPHPQADTANGTTSVPNSQLNTLIANGKSAHPQTLDPHPSPDAAKADTSVPNGQTSAEKGETSTNHSQPNALTASEEPAHPQTDTANGTTSTANPNERDTHPSGKMQNGQTSTENKETSTNHSQPNALTTSEKANEASRGEERAVEPFVPPTANEVRRFAETLHHPEFDAEWFVAYYTERHWRRHNGRPVVSWQTTARYWLDYPLRVARHLLDHRPAASPVSVGVGGPSAVVVPAADNPAAKPVGTSTYPAAGPTSSPSPGTHPVGTGGLSPRSSASPAGTGAPHVGSLSLPAPTPLQQSRLSDLKGMVLHLFADAPDVLAAAADVSTSASTPDWVARNSVRPARVLSPAEAAQVIAQQTLAVAEAEAVPHVVHDSTADAEASVRSCYDSTDDAEEGIDAQAFSISDTAKGIDVQALSPANAKESVRACDDSTDEDEEDIDAQALSPADTEEDARNGHDSTTDEEREEIDAQAFSTPDTEEGALNDHDSTTDAEEGIETQAFSTADAEESVRACDDATDEDGEGIDAQAFSPPDAAKDIETQAFSPANAKESVRACDDATDEDGEEIGTQAFSIPDAAKGIDAQALSPADAEESVRACDDATDEDGEDIETQVLSIPDAAGSLGALPFSADKGRWGVRSPRGPDPPTDDGHDSTDTGNDFADAENNFTAKPSNFSADKHPPAAVGTALAADLPISPADECRPLHTFTEKHPYLNPSFHESHPLLRLHPPSFGGFGRTFRVQSAQPPFGRSFLGRFVDIRPACTVGSRPLRPRLARCCAEHPERERTNPATAIERSANAVSTPTDEPEHGTDGRKRHDSAPERSANAISPLADADEHGAQRAKNADFIDVDPVRGHKIDRNAPEHDADERKRHEHAPERSANAVSTPVDAAEHSAQCAKNADFIDVNPACGHQTERNAVEHPANAVSPLADAGEHADRGCKRHDSAPEHPVDGHRIERNESKHADCERKRHDLAPEHPAYDPDAGQRVLRSAAHRRAVRAEREACCGALRHLAHCCVAF